MSLRLQDQQRTTYNFNKNDLLILKQIYKKMFRFYNKHNVCTDNN